MLVLSLNAGINKMAYVKNAVQSFNGGLYFHLYKDNFNGIVTSLSDLVSSSLINITTPTFTLSENLAQTSTTSTLVFNGTNYPLTSNTTSWTIITGSTITLLSSFFTFPIKNFTLPWPNSTQALTVEAPCTSAASSFDYTLIPSLPSWLSITPNSTSSTQTLNI